MNTFPQTVTGKIQKFKMRKRMMKMKQQETASSLSPFELVAAKPQAEATPLGAKCG